MSLGIVSARYTNEEYFRESPKESLRIGLSKVLIIPDLNISMSDSSNIDTITWVFVKEFSLAQYCHS